MSTLWLILGGISIVLSVLAALLEFARKAGTDSQKVKDAENQDKFDKDISNRVDKGLQNDSDVRKSANTGGLRDDDGHKRPS